jgi:hypothetical protein
MTDCNFHYRVSRPDGHVDVVPAEVITGQFYRNPKWDALCCNVVLKCKGFGQFRVSIDTSDKGGCIELWTDNGWTEVHTVWTKHLKVVRPHDRAVAASDFKTDVEELVRVACEILEG